MGYSNAQTRTVKALPTELPDPTTEQKNRVPEGAVWELEADTEHYPAGTKFRLQYAKPAQWVPVLKRGKPGTAETDSEDDDPENDSEE